MSRSTILVRTLIASAIFTIPINGVAQSLNLYMTGEALNDYCREYLLMRRNSGAVDNPTKGQSAGVCYGYVVGLVDEYESLRTPGGISGDNVEPFCTRGANAHSLTETVAIYLDQHPLQRNRAGYFLVRKILAERFPC
jgi:Rap1a immunity proteins